MAWEVFDRDWAGKGGVSSPCVTIRRAGQFALNTAALEALGQPEAVVLLFDKDEKMVGFQASDPADPNAFSLRLRTAPEVVRPTIPARTFLRHYGIERRETRRYPALFFSEMLVIDLKDEDEATPPATSGGPIEVPVPTEPDPEPKKPCRKCGVSKPPEGFPKNRHSSSGRATTCKECANADTKARDEQKREQREQRKVRALTNTDGEPKQCEECGKEKPLEDFPPDGRTHDGFAKICEVCDSEGKRLRGRPPKLPTEEGGKYCTRCGNWKPYEAFHQVKARADGRASICKACRNKVATANYKRSKEEARLCARGQGCVRYEPPFGSPAILDEANPGPLCRGCQQRAGLSA